MTGLRKTKNKGEKEKCAMDKNGIFMRGVILGRGRRYFGEDNKESVTYKVQCDANTYMVKDWSPNNDYYGVGDIVDIPIRVKTYISKGQTLLDYAVARDDNFGEPF